MEYFLLETECNKVKKAKVKDLDELAFHFVKNKKWTFGLVMKGFRNFRTGRITY